MKAVTISLIILLLSIQPNAAASGMSLEEAVNEVKSEGRVLSAKTVGGKHEIKILTPSGTVKTVNKKAANTQVQKKPDRPEYYKRGGQSMRDRKQNPAIPSRFNSRQNSNQKDNRQLDLQPMMYQNSNKSKKSNKKSSKTNNKKDK